VVNEMVGEPIGVPIGALAAIDGDWESRAHPASRRREASSSAGNFPMRSGHMR
jgi:hypothetical protein